MFMQTKAQAKVQTIELVKLIKLVSVQTNAFKTKEQYKPESVQTYVCKPMFILTNVCSNQYLCKAMSLQNNINAKQRL